MPSTDPSPRPASRSVFPLRGSYAEALRVGELLRRETVGGILLVAAATAAVVWANSPWAEHYFALRDLEFGYAPWHLELSVGAWAADGLLAVFFFLVGLELKREFVAGELRDPRRALVPVAAALGGVAVPALVYAAVNWSNPAGLRGWAIPAATDIAFAVAVLAIIGSHLPSTLRIFLLTLAVVDDLIAIAIIAVAYTSELQLAPLAWAVPPLLLYAFLAQRHRTFFHVRPGAAWFLLLPLGAVVWALVHASGIHATIAGVLLGFAVPVLHRKRTADDAGAGHPGEPGPGLAEVFEHRFRPLSAGFAVPVFAFFSAGVAIGGWTGFSASLADPVALGIVAGLVLGKPVGILATTWLTTRLSRASLAEDIRWVDLAGVGLLAGIGFTVSLLVAELSFGAGTQENDHAKVAIFLASLTAAGLAAAVLSTRNRRYRKIAEAEAVDADEDGIPDVYQEGNGR
ncbi:Na+/H+ antiporter NhaA [Zafaria sp. Z1313]|uniref:Na+/H+ antiporter NhaA n=1 Tax=unclassified Zafaria TaxID=2828765 RepID=UPI002E75DC66|nr:Na+/H+ antiporter NhaA [Zafaria sp. J156]MEE1621035.1 Na+/H+ antiporter NhaA [Zafaria sp. J156]